MNTITWKEINKLSSKIIATIGPSSSDKETLINFIKNGVQAFRFNFSHGNHKEQYAKYKIITETCKELNISPTLILDTKGPEIRTHEFAINTFIEENSNIKIFCRKEVLGNSSSFSVTLKDLDNILKVNEKILIDDGKLVLEVQKILHGSIICKALNSHHVISNRGVNIPTCGNYLSEFLSANDKKDLEFAVKYNFHWIAASFVNDKSNIQEMKNFLKSKKCNNIKICAKIESNYATQNLKEIIKISDAVMVARGDLGIEIDYAKVPYFQREIIKLSLKYAKPVIVATEMLESMTKNINPSRAEVSDVYNAAFAKVDSCMLSGESALGKFPSRATKVMSHIISVANDILYKETFFSNYKKLNQLLSKNNYKEISENTKFLLINGDNVNFKFICKLTNLRTQIKFIFLYSKTNLYNSYYYGFIYNCQSYLLDTSFQLSAINDFISNVICEKENECSFLFSEKDAN